MADDPKPRFEPEDLFPRGFQEGWANDFERAIGKFTDDKREHLDSGELARELTGLLKPSVWRLMLEAAAASLEDLATKLETAEIKTSSPAADIGARLALKTAIDQARANAAAFRAIAEHPPQT